MKKYLFIAIVVLGAALATMTKIYLNERSEKIRHRENYTQLEEFHEKKVATLELDKKQFEKQLDSTQRALLKQKNIKPKKVVQFIEVEHTNIDTIEVAAKVEQKSDTVFTFKHEDDCFYIQGRVEINLDVPNIIIEEKHYLNKSTYIAHIKRRSYKVLGIKTRILGKRYVELTTISDCGEETVKVINIKK
jgi:hypothetical protein